MKDTIKIVFIISMTAALTMGHYVTQLSAVEAHDLFRRLYFIPIIFGAYWFDSRGGILTAASISVLYLPFVLFKLVNPAERFDHFLEMILYFGMGTILGVLAGLRKKAFLRLENLTLGVIQSLVTVIEAHDPYTRGHSGRVMKIAGVMGRKMRLSSADLRKLKIGALLHDIGKVAVNLPLLNKQTRLSGDEMDAIKKHPEWGTHILETIRELQPVLPTVLHHHERYDGTGYPASLDGLKIPLHARIVAAADAFDALTTERPYHKAQSWEEAANELLRVAGSHLDPEITRLLVSNDVQRELKTLLEHSDGAFAQSDIPPESKGGVL